MKVVTILAIILAVLFVCCIAIPLLESFIRNRKSRSKGFVQFLSSDAFILDDSYKNARNQCWRSLDISEKAPDFNWKEYMPPEKLRHPYAFYFRIKNNLDSSSKKDPTSSDYEIIYAATSELIASFHVDNCNLVVRLFEPFDSRYSHSAEPDNATNWQNYDHDGIVGIVMIPDLDPESYDRGAITLWANGLTVGSEHQVVRYNIPLY